MPKGFDEEQKQKIRELLLDAAKASFSRYGYKKMSIREITKQTGIALGTFYKFFESKEELFFNVLISESEALRERLDKLDADTDNPEIFLTKMSSLILSELDSNKILEQILLLNELEFVLSRLSIEQLDQQNRRSKDIFARIFKTWQLKGIVKAIDIDLVSNAVRALFFLNFYKKEIGSDKFTQVFNFLLQSVIKNISRDNKP